MKILWKYCSAIRTDVPWLVTKLFVLDFRLDCFEWGFGFWLIRNCDILCSRSWIFSVWSVTISCNPFISAASLLTNDFISWRISDIISCITVVWSVSWSIFVCVDCASDDLFAGVTPILTQICEKNARKFNKRGKI